MAGREIDIVYAGHICWDFIPPFLNDEGVADYNSLIPAGGMVLMGKPVQAAGGPVTNTGVSIAKLGAKVGLIGKIGDDDFGYLTERWYEKESKELPNLDYSGIKMDKTQWTSYTDALIPSKIERTYLHGCGANDTFGYDDMDFKMVANAKVMAFGYPPWMNKIYSNNGAELTKILKHARELGTTTAIDLSVPQPGTEAGEQNWESILTDWIANTDIMVPSAQETYMFLRKEDYKKKREEIGKGKDILRYMSTEEISGLGKQMIEMGAAIAMIKCGPYGVYLRTGEKERLEKAGAAKPADPDNWANRELWLASYVVLEKFKGTLGAGDSAVAAFLTALVHGHRIENCLRYAVAAGTRNISVPDGLSWNRGFDDLTERISKGWGTEDMEKDTGRKMPGWKRVGEFYVGPADKGHGDYSPLKKGK